MNTRSRINHIIRDAPTNRSIYVGIDPGANGAIAIISKRRHTVIDIPTIKMKIGRKMRTVFDLKAICQIFDQLVPHRDRYIIVGLELIENYVGPGGAYGAAMIGRAFAMWPLYLHSLGLRLEEVRPQQWKKMHGLMKRDKQASRVLAQKLFPNAELHLKKHTDRAEALLIAEYVRRTHQGE